MNIHNYIHLYIGSPVFICNNIEGNPVIEPLTAKMLHEDWELLTNPDHGGRWRLMLRRLSDMSEAEALHIGKLAFFDREINYPDKDYRIWKSEPLGVNSAPSCYAIAIDNDWFDIEIRIGFLSGNLWIVKGSRIYNQPQIFHYLLQRGFWLFGDEAFEQNLIIDAKTITTMKIANPAQLFDFLANPKNKFPLEVIQGSVSKGFSIDKTQLFPYLMNFQRWLANFNEQQDGDWIAVENELPKESGRYWCYVKEVNDLGVSHYQWNCCYNENHKQWSDNLKSMCVTHWMPLPSPPSPTNHE